MLFQYTVQSVQSQWFSVFTCLFWVDFHICCCTQLVISNLWPLIQNRKKLKQLTNRVKCKFFGHSTEQVEKFCTIIYKAITQISNSFVVVVLVVVVMTKRFFFQICSLNDSILCFSLCSSHSWRIDIFYICKRIYV